MTLATCPERKLWKAVINQAVRDSLNMDLKAIRWFLSPAARIVFNLADIDQPILLKRLSKLLVLKAHILASGKDAYFDEKAQKVRWRKTILRKQPNNPLKKRPLGKSALASRFLFSPEGASMLESSVIPESQVEREALMERALLLAHAPDIEPEDDDLEQAA